MQLPAWKSLVSDRRYAAGLGLGISSGLSLLLVYSTQAAWLSDAKVPLSTIGLLSELTLAYKLKFLWAPFLDRYDPPLLGALLGRRRGWIVLTQLGVAAALTGIAFGDPAHALWWTIVFSLALGLAASTLDIVVDGWRINVVPKESLAAMTSVAEIGWRLGNFLGGAGALYLAQFYGWRAAYLWMAAATGPGIIAALVAPEPQSDREAPHHELSFFETIAAPIRDLVGRVGPMAAPILLLVAGFRMPGYIASAMAMPLFKHMHYSNADIATVTKVFGFWLAIGATVLGGLLVPRIGMMATLMLGTVAGSASHLSLAWLAAYGDYSGGGFWIFATAVSIDSFAYAFASFVLITYMSTLTTTELAASQFALLTSLVALPGSVLAAGSGFIIERTGFTWFFIWTSLIGVPVAILCWWVWGRLEKEPAPSSAV